MARRDALKGNSGTEVETGARRRGEGRRAGGSLAAGRAEGGSPQACRARRHLLGPRRVLARLRRLPPELRAEPSLLPVLPPPAPSAPRGSAGCLRRPLRWEEEEAPRASYRRWEQSKITVQSTGHLPQGGTHVPKAGWRPPRRQQHG